MSKRELRRCMRQMRDRLTQREALAVRICAHAGALVQAGQTAFVYASVGSEVDTWMLIRALHAKGCRICLPVIVGRGEMKAAVYEPGDALAADAYGIPTPVRRIFEEPESIDIAFVPGLAFTPSGGRLGYGGGYYDRFLLHTKSRRVGLMYSAQVLPALPLETWDVPMDVLVDENGVHVVQNSVKI